MSRDALPHIEDMAAAGEAILRYTNDITFEAFATNDERRAAVERPLFVIGEAAARLPDDWKQSTRPQCRGAESLASATSSPKKTGPSTSRNCGTSREARCQSSSQIFARCSATTSEDLAPRLGKTIPNSCAEGGRRRGNMAPANRTS